MSTTFYEDFGRRVAEDTLKDGTWISTVYLGIDHSFGGSVPLLFETMVFSNAQAMDELACVRYSTEQQAKDGHAAMVRDWTVKVHRQSKWYRRLWHWLRVN